MNRAWTIGVGLAILVGLAVVALVKPVHPGVTPEARAMRQLRDASIRSTEVLLLRVSTEDERVVCGLASSQDASEIWFVSTPERMIIGRRDNPAVQDAAGQYCRNAFSPSFVPTHQP